MRPGATTQAAPIASATATATPAPPKLPVAPLTSTSSGALVVPRALAVLRRSRPELSAVTREGTTPALVRALRAGTLDLALLSSRSPYRPPDTASPALEVDVLAETSLLLAVPEASPLGDPVRVEDLVDQSWIASPPSRSEPLLGVWPGLAGRPRVVHTARDWLTELSLVATGAASRRCRPA